MGNSIFKHSHLETTKDVIATLNWKVEAIKKDNLPIDSSLADYISYSVDNLNMQLKQIANAEQQLKQRKKEIKEQIESIKVGGATFLSDIGVDRLDGILCSSVSVSKAVEEKVSKSEVVEVAYLKPQNEIDELLISMGYAEEKTTTEEKVTKARPAKIRINKRKALDSDIVE